MNVDAKVLGTILSDGIIVEQGTGKLTLINCFGGFNAVRFPFTTPPFFITVFLTNMEGKPDEINLTVRIESPRNGLVHSSANIALKPGPDTQSLNREDVLNFPFRMQTSLPVAGKYVIKVLLDNQELDVRYFRVVSQTQTTSAEFKPENQ